MLEKLEPYVEILRSRDKLSWFEVLDAIANIIKIYDEEKANGCGKEL